MRVAGDRSQRQAGDEGQGDCAAGGKGDTTHVGTPENSVGKQRRLYPPLRPEPTVPDVMPGTPDNRHGKPVFACATVPRMLNHTLELRDRHVRYGSLLMIVAVGLSVGYAGLWQS